MNMTFYQSKIKNHAKLKKIRMQEKREYHFALMSYSEAQQCDVGSFSKELLTPNSIQR